MNTVLIKGGTVLSLDRAVGNMVDADVLIENGTIAEVGRALRARSAVVVDAADTIVLPGFVDSHRHLWTSLFPDAGTRSALDACGPARSDDVSPDDLYAATLAGLLQAVEAGITTVVDWCDIDVAGPHREAALAAHADSGIRTVFVSSQQSATPPDHTTLGFASPDLVEAELEQIAPRWVEARRAGLRIHAHAGTATAAGGEVAEMGRRGLLGPDVTLCRCTRLNDADFDAIARSSTAVSLTPASDMAAGAGWPPMQQLLDRDIRPGLGVGAAALTPRDVFVQMRAVMSTQHATVFDRKLAGRGGIPNLLGTREVIRYVTIDGARVSGLSGVTGSLTPGKRADVVVLRADRPNVAPVSDPIGAVVWGLDTSNVDWVFVDGATLVEHGQFTADVARARGLVLAAHRRMARVADSPAGAGAVRR
jgi:5-methylthioadenosine/S-adenosylhomocysteine deaminase